MSSFKKIMYVIYTVMFLLTIVGILYNDSLIHTFGLETSNTLWMFWSLLGFILLMAESVLENIHLSRKDRMNTQLARENTELKAKLYDDMVRVKDRPVVTGRDETTVVKPREDNPRPML